MKSKGRITKSISKGVEYNPERLIADPEIRDFYHAMAGVPEKVYADQLLEVYQSVVRGTQVIDPALASDSTCLCYTNEDKQPTSCFVPGIIGEIRQELIPTYCKVWVEDEREIAKRTKEILNEARKIAEEVKDMKEPERFKTYIKRVAKLIAGTK